MLMMMLVMMAVVLRLVVVGEDGCGSDDGDE